MITARERLEKGMNKAFPQVVMVRHRLVSQP